MRRRGALVALATLVAAPRAFAQPKLPRIAIVDPAVATAGMAEGKDELWSAFLGELRKLGHVEGKTVAIERWSGGGDISGYPALARRLVASQPQLIVERGRTMLIPIVAATQTIPVVAVGTIPPEFRQSGARPSRNVTGVQSSADDMQIYAKVLEFMRELLKPGARVAWIGSRPTWESIIGEATRKAAAHTKLTLQPFLVDSPVTESTVRRALEGIATGALDGIVVGPSTELTSHRLLIAEFAAAKRLPAIANARAWAEVGVPLTYGPDYPLLYRRAAHFVDKLLKGTKVADLPIEQPSVFQLVVNLNAAKKIGLTIPGPMRLRADQVIE